MASTNHTSLKSLSKSILNRLENQKVILFNPKERAQLQEALYSDLKKTILTEEDIVSQVREHVSRVSDNLSENNLTETDAFQSQKKALKARYGDHEVQGFFLQVSLRDVSVRVRKFLFDSPIIEDVFESDEHIQKLVMDTISGFNEANLS